MTLNDASRRLVSAASNCEYAMTDLHDAPPAVMADLAHSAGEVEDLSAFLWES